MHNYCSSFPGIRVISLGFGSGCPFGKWYCARVLLLGNRYPQLPRLYRARPGNSWDLSEYRRDSVVLAWGGFSLGGLYDTRIRNANCEI